MPEKQLKKLDTHDLSVKSLASYIYWVNQIPMLTQEEEKQLATRLHQHGDLDAARKLILAHLRFVVRVAKGYEGYGLPLSDLIQEGNIGLMKAVKRFDPKVGVRLVSFAVHWIRAEIHEFILRNWRIVKIATTKAQRKLFFNLRRASKKLGWFSEDEVQAISKELKVRPKDVRQMEARLSYYDQSLDFQAEDDEGNASWSPINFLEDQSADPETALVDEDLHQKQEALLYEALKNLDERSQEILKARWLANDKLTLHDLAKKYNVSAERIRQIESQAMKKIREHIITS